MEEIIVRNGKKFRLTPVEDDPQALIKELSPSPQEPRTIPQEKGTENPPLDEEIQEVKPDIKVKTPYEMIIKSAERLTRAKVEKARLNRKVEQDYNRVIGRHYRNPDYFYGEGLTDAQRSDELEDF